MEEAEEDDHCHILQAHADTLSVLITRVCIYILSGVTTPGYSCSPSQGWGAGGEGER